MKLNRIFAGAGLIILPFIFELAGDDQLRAPKAKAFCVLSGFYLAGLLWQKVNRYLAIGLASVFISAYFSKTVFSYEDLIVFLAAGISCFWVAKPKKHDLEVFFKIFELVGLFCAAYALLQFLELDPLLNYYPNADRGRPVILFGQHTLYGPFAVATFSVALFQKHWIRSLLLFLPILAINSSFTFLSLAVVVALFILQRSSFKTLVFMGFCGFAALALTHLIKPDLLQEPLNDKGRFVLWSQTLELANRRWLVGYGPGSFKAIYPIFQDKDLRRLNGIQESELSPQSLAFIKKAEYLKAESGFFLNPHNDFLHVYFALGILGVLAALMMIAQFTFTFWELSPNPEAWALAALFYGSLANSIGNFPLSLIPQALIPLWAFVAMTTMQRAYILEEYEHP